MTLTLWKRKTQTFDSAKAALVSAPLGVPALNAEPTNGRYSVDVYCCNCNPSFHFDAWIPRGVQVNGCIVECPRCGVVSRINNMHQAWPVDRRW